MTQVVVSLLILPVKSLCIYLQ